MPKLKMQGATPTSGKPLCHSCVHAIILKGQRCEEVIFCHDVPWLDSIVPFRVSECRAYHKMGTPQLHEMQQIAWEVKARKRGPVGFEQGEDKMEMVITPPKKDDGETPNGPTSTNG